MFEVITFGSAMVDVLVQTNVNEKNKHMFFPVGSKLLAESVKFEIGGGGTNTAVAFARFGLKTGYLGKMGDDVSGKNVLELLKKEKIKFLGKVKENAVSGHSIILNSKKHNRTIFAYKGINDELSISELKPRNLRTKWLYLSSMLKQSFKTQKKLAKILSQKGTKIAFNPTEYLIKNENIKPLLKLTEILVLNKEEAQMLTSEKDLLKGLNKLGPKTIVITDRDKPIQCYDSSQDKKYFLKPNKIKAVERTGAGDAFAAGFVAAIIRKKSIPEALKLGLREGESVIKHRGPKNNLIRMKL